MVALNRARWAKWLRRTPLHPQWLMPKRRVDERIRTCRGIVLDIGAADRWLRSKLEEPAGYIAFDFPTTAEGLYGARPDVFGDARCLPFLEGSISAIACYEVLEHVPDPESALAEMARVLAPGGVAELTMPFLYPVHDAPYDYQRWTIHGWRRNADKTGLLVEQITPSGHPLHAASVLACLALTGPLQNASGAGLAVRLAFAAAFVLPINLTAWAIAFVWPRWDAMSTANRVVLRKSS